MLTIALAAYWQRHCTHRRLGILKPVQRGIGDREQYSRLFSLDQSPEDINPIYLEENLAPPIAAERKGRSIDLEKIWQQFERLTQQRDFVLVEASGGLGLPITHQTTLADLAWDWRIPTVLVVPVLPGAIAHAVANVALARQARVHLKGIILNCVQPCHSHELDDWVPINLLQSVTQKPVLGCIPHLADVTDATKLAQVASHLDLERLLPLTWETV